jgi:hypothetical protein
MNVLVNRQHLRYTSVAFLFHRCSPSFFTAACLFLWSLSDLVAFRLCPFEQTLFTAPLKMYIVAYCSAVVICCLVLVEIWVHRFYNGLNMRNVEFSIFECHFACSPALQGLAIELLVFTLAQTLIGILIALCERWKTEPDQVSIQPVIWLLYSTLLIALSTEVCDSLC